ncbi:unnamed protein product [Rhizophagus irregularis]|nr:unnamed protein product [Rhizophagus irregularis]
MSCDYEPMSCANVHKAGLLTTLNSANLEFTTEPGAVALHCPSVVKNHNLYSGEMILSWLQINLIRRLFDDFFASGLNLNLTEILKVKINLRVHCPELQQYVMREVKRKMEEAGWIVKLDFTFAKVWLRVKIRKMANQYSRV